ncbi:MAG: hypothetical protein R3300_01200 [Candidatus Promineifilaceae bacterium]|nr:hypothetical protein [Candidatus Promineifilaceae bacterium]
MIACLSVPYFAATVERRNDNRLAQQANDGLVIGGQPWEPQPVYAFSSKPARRGVRPGMSLRLAHVLAPRSQFVSAHPPRYFGAAGEITDILTDFTPLVEPETLWLPSQEKGRHHTTADRALPARYTLDLESLPAKEALALSQEIGRSVRGQAHLSPAIGLAPNKFTAQVAAALTRPDRIRPVSATQENRFLGERSIHFLPLDSETKRRLRLLGIRTLGQLAALPPTELQTQFGRSFMSLYRFIRGEGGWPDEAVWRRVQPLGQERREQCSHHFGTPVSNLLVLENVLTRLATELAARLQVANLEARTLTLGWETDTASQIAAEPSQANLSRRTPTADPTLIIQGLRDLLRQACLQQITTLERGLTTLTVTVSDLTPIWTGQLALFGTLKQDSAAQAQEALLANIHTRHSDSAEDAYFFRPTLADRRHPLPERRFDLVPL